MLKYDTRDKSVESLMDIFREIEKEEKRFALEIVVEEKAKVLRALVLKRLDDVITLDDILDAFIAKKKVHDISVWALRED